MKSLQAPNFKTIALTKVICTAICSYADEAFHDISEESEKENIFQTGRKAGELSGI